MRSVKWPASPACDPVTVEVKMDDLHLKLDQLLTRSSRGNCPMCGICTQHSRQHEAMANQLSAQTKLLENLECKVMDLRTALEELRRGLEGRSWDKMSVPLVALQRRKSLPVRTSGDEVYVQLDKLRDQNIIQHTFNAPCGKGQEDFLIEDTEDVNKDLAKATPRLAISQPGKKTPNTAKLEEAKSPFSHKTPGVAGCIGGVTSRLDTVPQKLLTLPSKIHIPPPEMTSPPPLESTTKPNSTRLLKVETMTPSAKMSTFPQKAVPTISATKPKPTTATKQNLTPKTTQASVPFKTMLSSPNTSTIQTTVTGSTPLATNQKVPAYWSPAITSSPYVATSMSSNVPRFNLTENSAAPPSSIQSLQKASLEGPVGMSPGNDVSSFKPSQSPMLVKFDSRLPQTNSTITKPVPSEDEVVPPKTSVPTLSNLVTSLPNSPPDSSVAENLEPSDELSKEMSVCAIPQSLDRISTNAQTKMLANKLSTFSTPTPSAAPSFLKHVYSCPDSFQSLQVSGGASAAIRTQLFGKPANVTCTGPLKPEGIHIKLSPAPERTTSQNKMPPKTCFKIIDDVPPQPAPFPHRFVSLKMSSPSDFSIHTQEVLGGGRFGKVHKCTDTKTGLRLAAKIICTRSAKEREMVMNEIEVMNQLNHSNILQLFDAFEAKNQIVLVLEYVEGGELFERIVDESCPLTEVDAMVFVKQICEGVQYMHQMYVLHLDLKPENILCVNRSSHQIKIIDFGLARRYKPREKLKVSFGTPEFLAPEVVNFDFVSFPTDMWTLGVVTYMLLSGLSPFLGDDDSETLNNVLTVNWYFDEETFEHVSAEAKDFISNLLIKERSGRLSAAQCLKHPWLNNISEKAKGSNIILRSQVLLKKYIARRLWKKNYIAIAAANRFMKIGSSGNLTSLGV